MMQRLLEERFRMQVHREIREGPAYMMSVAKDGSKLQAATDDSCDPSPPADFIPSLALPPGGKPRCGVLTPPTRRGTDFILDERGVTVEAFAKLFQIGGLPVIDRTGIIGTFDIHLEWESSPPEPVLPGGDGAAESPDTSIISSIRKQLGLQLTPGKGPREFLVIGRLERPAAN